MQSEAPANETMSYDAAKVALCVDLKVADEEEPVAYYEVNAARRRTWMCGTEGSSGGFEALPEPLLEQIAGLSSLGSVLACRLVCKRWNYHFSCACKEMKPERPSILHRLKDEFPGVRHLDLTRCLGIRNRNLKNILKSKVPIESLALGQDVHKTQVKNQASSALLSNAALDSAAKTRTITCLTLVALPAVTNEGIKLLCKRTQLKSLHIICCTRLSSEAFVFLDRLTNLQSLTIQKCPKVDVTEVTQLESLPKLGRLNLGGPWQAVNFANFLPVFPGMLSRLHTLELGFFPLSFANSNRLRAMTHLKGFGICLLSNTDDPVPLRPLGMLAFELTSLNTMYSTTLQPANVYLTPGNMAHFQKLKSLKLTLRAHSEPGEVQALSAIRSLTALALDQSDAPDDCMAAVSALTQLKIAEFPGTHIPKQLLEAVLNLPHVEKLGLTGPRLLVRHPPMEFTLMPMLAFAHLRTVRALDLSYTKLKYEQAADLITRLLCIDKTILGSWRRPCLEQIILEGCDISPEGYQHLSEMFPSVQVRRIGRWRLDGSTQPWEDNLALLEPGCEGT